MLWAIFSTSDRSICVFSAVSRGLIPDARKRRATASIVSRELQRPLTVSLEMTDKELPPVSDMEGIDLVTEGILTLSKVERLLAQGSSEKKHGPAHELVSLLQDSDKITFIVGTRINVAHQDPNLPVELEIRRNVVKKIKDLLEMKYLKDVEIIYL